MTGFRTWSTTSVTPASGAVSTIAPQSRMDQDRQEDRRSGARSSFPERVEATNLRIVGNHPGATVPTCGAVIANGYLRLDHQEWVRAVEKRSAALTDRSTFR